MAEPATLNARLLPLPVRDPNRPIADALPPPARRPARPGPDGFQAPALPGPDLRLSNEIGIRPPARPGSSGAALGPVAAKPRPTGIADRPGNPGDIGAPPRLEQRPPAPLAQRPDGRPAAEALAQQFEPPQRLLDLLDAQRGRTVAADLARQARTALFGQPDVAVAQDNNNEEVAAANPATGFPVEPGPAVEFQPAPAERPAFQRIAELAADFRAQDARRIFAAIQADAATATARPVGQPPVERILIDQRV